MTKNLNFKENNPGVVQYGNFINYYQFHPPETRLHLLPTDIWNPKSKDSYKCLDIGCNSGDLTMVLVDFIHNNVCENCSVLGIDIDPVLITRAKERNTNDQITFETINFMDAIKRNEVFTCYLQNKPKFDITFCFSTTMWIHLNYGDDGLIKFLKDVCDSSEIFVVEPQPWKCYRTAVKRLKIAGEMFPYYKKLKIKSESAIEDIILSFGAVKLFESERTNWRRKIMIFKC